MTTTVGTIFSLSFWRDAAERAIKTSAQTLALAVGGNGTVITLWSLDPKQIAGVVLSGAVLSIATSILSAPFSNPGTASVTKAVEAAPTAVEPPSTAVLEDEDDPGRHAKPD